MKIIDTHQHVWDLGKFTYSWCKGIPKLNRSFLMKDYLEASRNTGIVKSVFVECDVDEPYMLEETRWIFSLADDPSNPMEGVVACCRPEREDFRQHLAGIVGHPKLKGLRRVLHVMPDDTSQAPLFAENLRSLEQYNLTFDLCMLAKQLPLGVNLIKKCPRVSFVLDHCGVPQVKEKRLDPWRQHIREIAAFPNVVCKVSGLVANADPERWTVDDLRPFVEHVLECFGWDRVMFGGDWPVCTLSASLQQWVDAALTITKNATEQNQHKLFYQNAQRVYRLG